MRSPHLAFLAPLAAAAFVAASMGCLSPGFVPAEAPGDGPSLTARADVDEAGSRAIVHVDGVGLGPAFGLSFHVVLVPVGSGAVALANPSAAVPFERVVAHASGADASFGGSGLSAAAGDVVLGDGELATLEVSGAEAGVFDLRVVDPVLRRADGSFVPCAAAGGTLTLEVAR